MIAALLDGRPAQGWPLDDRGLHYGDGLFETVALYRGEPLLWERHMARLRRGGEVLGIRIPSEAMLYDEMRHVGAGTQRAVGKIIVTRGSGTRGYAPIAGAEGRRLVLATEFPAAPREFVEHGVSVCWCTTPIGQSPRLAGIKHLNRLEQVLARAEWQDEFAEGLLCDADGRVIEGTKSNLFIVLRGTLMTPDLSQSGVAGVMREEVLAAAERLGLRCEQRAVQRADVQAAQELFLTNSIIGVWPVCRLGERTYPRGEITQTIQKAIAPAQCFALELRGTD